MEDFLPVRSAEGGLTWRLTLSYDFRLEHLAAVGGITFFFGGGITF